MAEKRSTDGDDGRRKTTRRSSDLLTDLTEEEKYVRDLLIFGKHFHIDRRVRDSRRSGRDRRSCLGCGSACECGRV
jgi:hypothetical protein